MDRLSTAVPIAEQETPEAAGEVPTASAREPQGTPRPDPVQQRRRLLSPYLQLFCEWSFQQKDPEQIPHFADIAGRPMDLGCWERAELKRAGTPGRSTPRAFQLMTEGVAYQLRCLHVLGLFSRGPLPSPEDLPQFLERLNADLAVGMALEDELQWDIDMMISKGQLADAKPVSDFRNKILQCLKQLKERVGDAGYDRAKELAEGFVALDQRVQPVLEEPPQAAEALEEQVPEAHAWAAYGETRREPDPQASDPESATPGRRAQAASRSRLRPLVYSLAALSLIYVVLVLPPGVQEPLPRLTLKQFAHVVAVQRIVARPPSLFVIVHPDRWGELTPVERLELVTEVGRVADVAGYTGAHVRIRRGASVGQWLRSSGVKLWARPAEAT